MLRGQTTPAHQDPEMVAGAHHQNWLAHVMDTVGNILGGDTTLHVTKKADGSVEVTHDPSTEGEKWGRVAAAALGGASRGLAVGQGPGGPSRAAAAGIQSGLAAPQQALTEANQEATAEQERLMRGANIARLNQEVVRGAWDNAHLSRNDLQQQADYALAHHTKLEDMGAIPVAMNVTDHDKLTKFGVSDPLSVQAHMGQNGEMLFNEPDGKNGVNFYRIPADVSKQRTTDDDHWTETKLDPNDPTKTIEVPHVNKAGSETNGTQLTRHMAQAAADDKVKKQAYDAKIAKQRADAETQRAADEAKKTPAQISEANARAREAGSTAALNDAKMKVLQGAGAGGKGTGLNGDAYLQASGIDPSAWNQIKATANGDVKIPTASRSPQNQAFRNAVLNYDPTFTDARYQAKQDFKTKQDATNIVGLATALEHLDSATQHSAQLGFSPSLATGKTMTGTAADYNQDIKLFTEEAGKLVANKAITQGEYEDLKKDMASPLQRVRDSALSETVKLMGGRVHGLVQKYQTATGQQLNPKEFFDQATQDRLQKYGIVSAQPAAGGGAPPPAGGGAAPPPPAGGAPTPPINLIPVGHDVSFKNHGGVWRNVNGVAKKVSDN
jgi:hypothetical protein